MASGLLIPCLMILCWSDFRMGNYVHKPYLLMTLSLVSCLSIKRNEGSVFSLEWMKPMLCKLPQYKQDDLLFLLIVFSISDHSGFHLVLQSLMLHRPSSCHVDSKSS